MRCRACNCNLSDREASTKWLNWQEIKNPEERYIGLCAECNRGAGVSGIENSLSSDTAYEDRAEEIIEEEEPDES